MNRSAEYNLMPDEVDLQKGTSLHLPPAPEPVASVASLSLSPEKDSILKLEDRKSCSDYDVKERQSEVRPSDFRTEARHRHDGNVHVDAKELNRVTFMEEEQEEDTMAERTANPVRGEQFEMDNGTTLLLGVTQDATTTQPNMLHPRPRPPLQIRLKSTMDLYELGRNETELKANLYFHIGNPIKRWKIDRIIPVRLILQIIKTLCLVVQVSIFTQTIPHQRAEFFFNSREVFENLFLGSSATPRGVYTSFTIQDLFERFDHICHNYYKLPNITIGGYDFQHKDGYPVPVKMILRQYTNVTINATEFTFILDGRLKTVNFTVSEGESASELYKKFSGDPLFNRFFDMMIIFPINNIRIVHRNRAECFTLTVNIAFVSDHDSGKITYHLTDKHKEMPCSAHIVNGSNSLEVLVGFLTVLDAMLIIMSFLSIFLMLTTMKRAVKLARAMGAFYQDQLHIKLGLWERRSLFSGWHFLNFISDVSIMIGTLYKIALNFDVIDASPARILLGTAILFQAGVVLRYVSYFKKLNALNRTLSIAFPELVKFLLCAGLLFLAFSLAGFIVLGPFYEKFASFYKTFETLFSLLNGNDIYGTFNQFNMNDDLLTYLYSRFFLYSFLVLFIYFVLNLFTSLVITAYEKSQHRDNAEKNEVRRFIFSGPLTPNGVALRDVTLTKKYVDPQVILKRRTQQREVGVKKRGYSFENSFSTSA